ncbi:hypothetical protein [Flavobacterium sp.]|uniref:hypothetical protein n=1 Tax=Flavobacterium sp. TaxID=239 RepID=UPI0025BD4A19|nr:hypothetical protein [Flavobacterium sp.]MBA4276245.1 hypothetical protein [Flavobacterium sp.]
MNTNNQLPLLKRTLQKPTLYSLLLFFFLGINSATSQNIDNNGCVLGNFGIDGDLYSGSLIYGDTSPATPLGTDDWFAGETGTGVGVIQTTNSAAIQTLLQGTGDPVYEARMNGYFGAVVNGRIWYDAIYARDNFGGTGFVDPTAFPVSSKNTQPPSSWSAGPANVLGKNDLLDVAAHIRRLGSINASPLFLTGLISRAEPGGAAYMDMEFFIKDVTYTAGVGFSSAGNELGHTAYHFDAAGKLTQMGDMMVNISLNNGGAETDLEVRIWVKRADRLNASLIPASFNWGINYDGPTTTSEYVYASIVPKNAGGACGYVNGALQFPAAAPWGHKGSKENVYRNTFPEYALAEIGLNLTEFGLDPAFVPGYDSCEYPHKSFCVKTRSSASFTAALKDFAGPYALGRNTPLITSTNSLSCSNPTTTLTADPNRTDIVYSWTTTNGHIVSGQNTAVIVVDQIGDYTLTGTMPNGCPIDGASFEVTYDTSKPFFNAPQVSSTISCSGTNGTINLTVTGATAPYTYSWTGPSSYTSTSEDPQNLIPGTYNVVITDNWGCTTSTSVEVIGGTPIVFNPTVTNVSCNGQKNGSISINPIGTSPFTFSWSNGQTVQNIQNIGAGSYSVNATDANGCVWSATYTVTQPNTLSSSITKIDDTNVDPAVGNGSIALTVIGGTGPYSYSWSGPSSFTATTEDLSALKYGQYQVTVTDANGCATTNKVFVYEPEICNDGIDNNGNGQTDCEETSCIPLNPGTITPSKSAPCVGDSVTYTVTNNPAYTYVWTVPADVVFTGQGTNQITITWASTQGGNICVKANNVGCLSTPSCMLVSPNAIPVTPTPLNLINH